MALVVKGGDPGVGRLAGWSKAYNFSNLLVLSSSINMRVYIKGNNKKLTSPMHSVG